MRIGKSYIENSTSPFVLEWIVQTGINIFVALLCVGALFFMCSLENNTYQDILLYHVIFFVAIFILLLYELYVSKIIISLKIDQKRQRIVYVNKAKIVKIKIEHTLTRFDSSSCVCWFYPKKKDVDRYIVHFADDNNLYKVKIVMSAKKQFYLLLRMRDEKQLNFCFFEKSKIFICFDEDDDNSYEKVDKRNRKGSLNNYI